MLGMLLVGVLIYALMRWGGHYYVEGVGYATIQATLTGQLAAAGFLLLLFACKLCRHIDQPRLRLVGRHLLAVAVHGRDPRRRLRRRWRQLILPGLPISVPAFAMVGMGAMVGSGTGAAMTAVAMIFEMTRDYDIVLPMILAVAVGLGVRRMLSRENIYTMKLVRRGHPIPKALHANMFLVRSARDAMERDVLLIDEATSFDEFLRMTPASSGMRHVVVTRGNLIVGVLRVNTALRRTVSAGSRNVTLGALAQRNFTIVRADVRGVRRDRPAAAARRSWGSSWRDRAGRVPTTWSASSPRNTSPTRWRRACVCIRDEASKVPDARATGLYGIRRFAQILRRDIDAVRNAVGETWSNWSDRGSDQQAEDPEAVDVRPCRDGTTSRTHATFEKLRSTQIATDPLCGNK